MNTQITEFIIYKSIDSCADSISYSIYIDSTSTQTCMMIKTNTMGNWLIMAFSFLNFNFNF